MSGVCSIEWLGILPARRTRRLPILLSAKVLKATWSSYLLRDILQVLPDQIVACGVEQHRKAVRIAEGDQMRLSGKELDVEHTELLDLRSGDLRVVYAISQGGV